jgi:hypothetical protein
LVILVALLLVGASLGSSQLTLRSLDPYPGLAELARSGASSAWAAPGRKLKVVAVREMRKPELPALLPRFGSSPNVPETMVLVILRGTFVDRQGGMGIPFSGKAWAGYMGYLFDARTGLMFFRGGSFTGASFGRVLNDPWIPDTEVSPVLPPVGERFLDQVNRISYDVADLVGTWSERIAMR